MRVLGWYAATPSPPPTQEMESNSATRTKTATTTIAARRRRHSSVALSRQKRLLASVWVSQMAPSTSRRTTPFETQCTIASLAQPDPGVGQGIAYVGEELREDEQEGAEVDHGPERGEVIAVEGVDRERAE